MIVTEKSTLIRRPVEEVFRYVSHMEYLPEWGEGVVASKQISGLEPGPGAIYRCTISPAFAGLGITGEYRMEEFEADRKLVCRLNSSMVDFEDIYLFDETPEGTRFRVRNSIKLSLFLVPAGILVSAVVRDRITRAHEKLIARLEGTSRKRTA